MSPRRARCPSPVALERAFWSDDARARAHAGDCESCGREWGEIAALVEAGRAIPPPAPAPERREEIRTALLSKERWSERAPARVARPRWLAVGVAAAALGVVWWIWPRGEVAERSRLLAHDGARYLRASRAPDEIVRLVDGTVTVEVDRLQPGERFRIITGDAEVEVRGTAFDVTATADRLRSVRVIHGTVEVRAGSAVRVLTGGQAWKAPEGDVAGAAGADAGVADAGVAGASVAGAGPGAAVDASGRSDRRERRRGAAMQSRVDGRPASATRAAAQQAYDDGWAALRAGAFERAAAAFERAASRDRAGAIAEDARYWRAVALARGGQPSATAAFESFLADHPSSPRAGEASVILGWLLFDRGDYKAAARRFRAGATDPSDRVRASAAKGLGSIRRAER